MKTFWISRDNDDAKYRLHEAHTNEPLERCQCSGYFSSNGYHASFSENVMKMLGVKFFRPGEKAQFKLVRIKKKRAAKRKPLVYGEGMT